MYNLSKGEKSSRRKVSTFYHHAQSSVPHKAVRPLSATRSGDYSLRDGFFSALFDIALGSTATALRRLTSIASIAVYA